MDTFEHLLLKIENKFLQQDSLQIAVVPQSLNLRCYK